MQKLLEAKRCFLLRAASLFLSFSSSTRAPDISSSSKFQTSLLLHLHVIKTGLIQPDSSTGTDLLLAYFSYGQTSIALSLFKIFFRNNTRLLNYRIKELLSFGFDNQVIDLYQLLQLTDGRPDDFTFPLVLKACARLSAIDEGEITHVQIYKLGFGFNVVVANSLIDMYWRCGFLIPARLIFDKMPDRNTVSWNSIISGYGFNGCFSVALGLCSLMRGQGMRLDQVGLKIVLPICGQLGELNLGKSIHAYVVTSGLGQDQVLVTAIMDMYAKCGELSPAEKLFCCLPSKDVVAWNAMLSGYSRNGDMQMVLKLFHDMQAYGLKPSFVTALITLHACADLSVLSSGEVIHGCIIKLGIDLDLSVNTLLVDMYCKCGKLISAAWILNGVFIGSVNLWSSVIHGLGMHGHGEAALMAFFQMLKRGVEPDEVCFLVTLSSCSHAGLVKVGQELFSYMVNQYGMQPRMEHHAAMVDLYGRAGLLSEAFEFISGMSIEPDISVWGAFLGACRIHSKLEIGQEFGKRLVELGPKTAGYYKLLLSFYAEKGYWNDVDKIRRLIEEKKLGKNSGCSLIEMSG
ncbi:hypothetical protein H6P81_017087 [Aristolochia fimbriata]|uniref:Pentatricopeptide repeat-containing protein n=1 Tax=Aristolochia fimbriata TaxID=158543 RepID=A0AAV7DXD1_ARIFI|nr:hypothetical protein H6P81_017087 [Aristolochia fimbriata]